MLENDPTIRTTTGFGIAGELFEHRDAPVKRVGALDTFVGYNPALEDAILPQVATVAAALRETAGY